VGRYGKEVTAKQLEEVIEVIDYGGVVVCGENLGLMGTDRAIKRHSHFSRICG
jgi:hypothetical protein